MIGEGRANAGPGDSGMLDVGDGHRIHWEAWGNPMGKPAVVLHGGPGSGSDPARTRCFDLDRYRVIQFDQRGCGRSKPHAAEDVAALEANTTQHLVADIERLRARLGFDRWLVYGISWGSTLALAYTEAHPGAVTELVLASVVTTTRREVEWVTRDSGRFFPEEWQRFRAGVTESDRGGSLAAAYYKLLLDPDPAVHTRAALDWCAWEDRHVRTKPDDWRDSRYDDPAFRLCFARLVTHYWSHAAWLEEDTLIRDAARLDGIPGVLIHGRLDLSAPLDIPWRLNQAWRSSELVILDDEGHRGGANMIGATESALSLFAERS
jgi:proline iminopeptidase